MKLLQLLFAGSLLFCLAACQESWDLDRSDFSQIEIEEIEILSPTSARIKAKVYDLSFFSATDYGFLLTSDGTMPTIFSFDEKNSIAATDSGVVSQSFEMTKSDLPPGTSFAVRAYAEVDGFVMYSDSLLFETPTGMVSTLAIEYVGGESLTIKGKLSGTERGIIGIKHGFCWSSTSPNPNLLDESVNLGSKLSNNEFKYIYEGLINGSPLHFRAYGILQANESIDTIYGEIKTFDGVIRDRWEVRNDFLGFGREGAVSFSINGKAYLVGGRNRSIGTFFKDVWEYDPQSDSWTQKGDFIGSARREAVGFTLNDKGYYGLGSDGNYLADFYEYNPSDDSWTTKADFPAAGRTSALGLSDNQYGYITTGYFGGFDNKIYRFDPSIGNGLWQDYPGHSGFERYSAAGFILDSLLYVIGGQCARPSTECNFMLGDVWAFNLNNKTWEKKPNFPGGTRIDASSFAVNGRGYVGFGSSFYRIFLDDLWSFKEGKWTKMATLENGERAGAANFVINDQVFFGLGNVKIEFVNQSNVYTYTKDMWLYNPPQ